MNQFLAEIYGTRETIGATDSSDTEKLAEAQFIGQMCRSEGVDVDQLTDQDVVKIAYEIWGPASEIVKEAAEEGSTEHEGEEPPEEEKKEEEEEKKEEEEEPMEEKAAQADMLGRIMAHSFTQERGLIEKQAAPAFLKSIAKKGKEAVKVVTKAGKRVGKEVKKGGKAVGREAAGTAKGLAALAKRRPFGTAAAGLGLTGLGAVGGYAARGKEKEKESSALDALAEERALEILKEAGVVTTEEEKVAAAIEARALEMLREAGYEV